MLLSKKSKRDKQSNNKTYHNVCMRAMANNVRGREKIGYSRKKVPKKIIISLTQRYEIRSNEEIYNGGQNLIGVIRTKRLSWLGHANAYVG